MIERTLLILKPDSISRGLVGNLIDKFEKVGLKMVACKMAMADRSILDKMYNEEDDNWLNIMGEKTLATLKEYDIDAKKVLKETNTYNIGKDIAKNLKNYMTMGPIILTVWEGIKAVSVVRKIRGGTTPLTADYSTITGSLSHDSQIITLAKGRSLMNLAHASGTKEEAEKEIAMWFGKDFKPIEYTRSDSSYF